MCEREFKKVYKKEMSLIIMEERVQKLIANSGYCSRRDAEELISKGKVRVNGRAIKLGDKADIDKDEIYVHTTLIEKAPKIYLMLNKPRGYEVSMSPTIQKSVMRLLPIEERVVPVGRLDKDTTGLLLFTNDGDFANKITHPRYEKEKTYAVVLDRKIAKEDIMRIKEGIHLKDGFIKSKIKQYSPTNLEVTIHEGKKWIIKRLFFSLGYYVKELSRTRIGPVRLDVKIGKWRYLHKKEVEMLMR